MTLLDAIRRYARDEAASLPLPAHGATAARHRALYEVARRDLTLARLAEAHTDAIAILSEAGRTPSSTAAVYGVWAAERPSLRVTEHRDGPTRSWTIDGTKAFCTGAQLVDRALVTVPTDSGSLLFDIDARDDTIAYDTSEWVAPAFAATRTATATFRDLRADEDDLVGTPGWYVERSGFWHGAIGPAACWACGAAGLVDAAHVALADRTDPITDVGIGSLVALRWRLEQLLDGAGNEIDARPDDLVGARRRALVCRHEIDTAAGEIVDRYARLVGPRPLAFDAGVVSRVAEVELYRRQSHAELDLAQVGGELREGPTER